MGGERGALVASARLLNRAKNLLKFRLELLLVRGTGVRLLLIAALIGLVSVVAGIAVQAADHSFDGPLDAIWWAFLRLSDPGYLGDDEGMAKRLVSTLVTVLGYVLFLGALVAILTQWLNETLRNLESGFTPIAVNDHVLVLGMTSRTATILAEMRHANDRVRRFLDRHEARTLRLVLLASEVDPGLRFDLREQLGPLWSDRGIILRSGNPLRMEHLRRVDFLNAAAILIPSDDLSASGALAADTRTIKTLLSMSKHVAELDRDEMPLVVAEILDLRKVVVALRAYDGPLELVASDHLVGCMLAQAVLFRGVSGLLEELFVYDGGNGLHIIRDDRCTGLRFDELSALFPHGVVLGMVRPEGRSFAPVLAPRGARRVEPGEALVVVARSHEDALPDDVAPGPVVEQTDPPPLENRRQRILVLGWSSHVPGLITEIAAHPQVKVSLDVMSVISVAERLASLASYGDDLSSITLRHLEGDFTLPRALRSVDPAAYDEVVIIASDWPDREEDRDARSILGFLLLQEILTTAARRPRIVVELGDASNADLFDDPKTEVLVTPVLVGQMLAQVALRPELRAVYEELLGLRGADLASYAPADFGVEQAEASFRELAEAVARRSSVLVGIHAPAAGAWSTHVNPPKASRWELTGGVRLIVLNDPAIFSSRELAGDAPA
jgi:ion channel POLLUX/CASTOR